MAIYRVKVALVLGPLMLSHAIMQFQINTVYAVLPNNYKIMLMPFS